MALVAVQSLNFAYAGSQREVLRDVSFTIDPGEFVLLIGQSGCGKTTLLRHLKTALTPHGRPSGSVMFDDRPLEDIGLEEQTRRIGFVLQNPDNQIVTDKVWHELAFGLESLGTPREVIRRRVAEMASFFGIVNWYHRDVETLSGGQKQLLNLAAVMTMQPDLLVLDEPTAQLDPIAAVDFLAAAKRINDELGTTVLVTEHRLESAFPLSDRVLVMNQGKLIADECPHSAGATLARQDDPMVFALPAAVRLALTLDEVQLALTASPTTPMTIREGRTYLRAKLAEVGCESAVCTATTRSMTDQRPSASLPAPSSPLLLTSPIPPSFCAQSQNPQSQSLQTTVIEANDVWFRYSRNSEDVLRGLDMSVNQGEFACLLGGNGSGKTTTLGALSGLNKPYRGKIKLLGLNPAKAKGMELFRAGLSVLPQDPQTLFMRNTIFDDLDDAARAHYTDKSARETAVEQVAATTEITSLLRTHPYDVSGGEQQRAALAMALLTNPKVLFLDEPTKGMDAFFKAKLASVLHRLIDNGLTILMVSHDVEFAALYASRCMLFFDGSVVTEGAPREFFVGNSFYTTAANRIGRGLVPGAVSVDDLVAACRVPRANGGVGLTASRSMASEGRTTEASAGKSGLDAATRSRRVDAATSRSMTGAGATVKSDVPES
ncbi:MAG: ATP-binding cassette domain-containing protein [Propionibacteriaceae bacterium]|nr:ATP-binding cassette domain-containing protein [Propionibacteriaceae bacterium]